MAHPLGCGTHRLPGNAPRSSRNARTPATGSPGAAGTASLMPRWTWSTGCWWPAAGGAWTASSDRTHPPVPGHPAQRQPPGLGRPGRGPGPCGGAATGHPAAHRRLADQARQALAASGSQPGAHRGRQAGRLLTAPPEPGGFSEPPGAASPPTATSCGSGRCWTCWAVRSAAAGHDRRRVRLRRPGSPEPGGPGAGRPPAAPPASAARTRGLTARCPASESRGAGRWTWLGRLSGRGRRPAEPRTIFKISSAAPTEDGAASPVGRPAGRRRCGPVREGPRNPSRADRGCPPAPGGGAGPGAAPPRPAAFRSVAHRDPSFDGVDPDLPAVRDDQLRVGVAEVDVEDHHRVRVVRGQRAGERLPLGGGPRAVPPPTSGLSKSHALARPTRSPGSRRAAPARPCSAGSGRPPARRASPRRSRRPAPSPASVGGRGTRSAAISQRRISRLPPQVRPSTTRRRACQRQPSPGSIGGSPRAGRVAPVARLVAPLAGGVRSYQPEPKRAARSESSVSGCGAPARPRCTITDPPW